MKPCVDKLCASLLWDNLTGRMVRPRDTRGASTSICSHRGLDEGSSGLIDPAVVRPGFAKHEIASVCVYHVPRCWGMS